MTNAVRVLFLEGGDNKYHDFNNTSRLYLEILEKAGFQVTLSRDLEEIRAFNLHKYDVIINGTVNVYLPPEAERDLLDAVIGHPWNTGKPKGFIGLHGAACTFRNSENYIRMIGGLLLTHPYPGSEKLLFEVETPSHPVMAGVNSFELSPELYLMETYPPFEVLLSCCLKGFRRPVAWVKPYGFGRVFYLSLGHDEKEILLPEIEKMIINAVRWTVAED